MLKRLRVLRSLRVLKPSALKSLRVLSHGRRDRAKPGRAPADQLDAAERQGVAHAAHADQAFLGVGQVDPELSAPAVDADPTPPPPPVLLRWQDAWSRMSTRETP